MVEVTVELMVEEMVEVMVTGVAVKLVVDSLAPCRNEIH